MIEPYKSKYLTSVLDLLHNKEFSVTDEKTLNKFLKKYKNLFIMIEKGDCLGLIGTYTFPNEIGEYIKIVGISDSSYDKLLTVLLWHCKKDLYIRFKKGSNFINIFKNKNFEFIGYKDNELLFYRKYRQYNK